VEVEVGIPQPQVPQKEVVEEEALEEIQKFLYPPFFVLMHYKLQLGLEVPVVVQAQMVRLVVQQLLNLLEVGVVRQLTY
jgi:hypothetical protein